MPKRFGRAFFVSAAAVAASLVTGIGAFAGPASAAPVSTAGHRATIQCQAVGVTCVTLRQYDTSTNTYGLAMEASGVYPNAPIVVDPYDNTSFLQDWTYIYLGTLSSYCSSGSPDQPDQWGLTAFDCVNYGTDTVYELEFSPAGIPTGLCAADVSLMMELRWCNGSKFQTAITAHTVLSYTAAPIAVSPPSSHWGYGLALPQQSTPAHHYTATGSTIPGTQITFRTVGNYSTQWFAS